MTQTLNLTRPDLHALKPQRGVNFQITSFVLQGRKQYSWAGCDGSFWRGLETAGLYNSEPEALDAFLAFAEQVIQTILNPAPGARKYSEFSEDQDFEIYESVGAWHWEKGDYCNSEDHSTPMEAEDEAREFCALLEAFGDEIALAIWTDWEMRLEVLTEQEQDSISQMIASYSIDDQFLAAWRYALAAVPVATHRALREVA